MGCIHPDSDYSLFSYTEEVINKIAQLITQTFIEPMKEFNSTEKIHRVYKDMYKGNKQVLNLELQDKDTAFLETLKMACMRGYLSFAWVPNSWEWI